MSRKIFVLSFLISTCLSFGAYRYALADGPPGDDAGVAAGPGLTSSSPPSVELAPEAKAALEKAGVATPVMVVTRPAVSPCAPTLVVAHANADGSFVCAPPGVALHDPFEDPIAAWSDAQNLRKAGWPFLVFGGLLGVSKALAYFSLKLRNVPVFGVVAKWLAVDKRVVWVAGIGAIGAAGYDVLLQGGTWVAAAFAGVAILIGLVHPTTTAKPATQPQPSSAAA